MEPRAPSPGGYRSCIGGLYGERYVCLCKSHVSAKKSTPITVYPAKRVLSGQGFISPGKNRLENVGCNVLK